MKVQGTISFEHYYYYLLSSLRVKLFTYNKQQQLH